MLFQVILGFSVFMMAVGAEASSPPFLRTDGYYRCANGCNLNIDRSFDGTRLKVFPYGDGCYGRYSFQWNGDSFIEERDSRTLIEPFNSVQFTLVLPPPPRDPRLPPYKTPQRIECRAYDKLRH